MFLPDADALPHAGTHLPPYYLQISLGKSHFRDPSIASMLSPSVRQSINQLQVSKAADLLGDADDSSPTGEDKPGEDGDDDGQEFIGIEENAVYLAPLLRMCALLHTFTALAMIIGYYCLKVGYSTVGADTCSPIPPHSPFHPSPIPPQPHSTPPHLVDKFSSSICQPLTSNL